MTDAHNDTVREKPDEPLTLALWQTLRSVRTTIYLLPLIAVATTIGAVIPQGRPPEYYAMAYGATRGRIVTTLGFDNLYNSTWFIILIAILLLNLAACVGRSFKRSGARYRGPKPEALARKFSDSRAASCWAGEALAGDLVDKLSRALRRARYAVTVEDGPKHRSWLLVRKWPLAHYGGILTHVAILLVAVGAVLGCLPWTSLDDRVTLAEGETYYDDGKLGFDVRLDDFRMNYYEETGQPSSYESDITLLADGAEAKQGTATVNSQVVYRRLALGQSSWGLAAVDIVVSSESGEEEQIDLALTETAGAHGGTSWVFAQEGRVAFLDGEKSALVADLFVPEAFERDGEIVGSASEYPRDPAVALQLVTGLEQGEHEFHDLGWLRLGEEATAEGYTVRFRDLVYISTLSARRDPGLPFVWAGFILTSLGMVVVFYVRPRAFLVELTDVREGKPTQVRVALAGRELIETDRRVIEAACGAGLRPMQPGDARRASA